MYQSLKISSKKKNNLHKELIDLDKNQRERDILRKKFMVLRANKRKSVIKKEREFALTFAQHKNVIAKHANLGEKRRRDNEYHESSIKRKMNHSQVKNLKHQSEDSLTTFRSFMRSGRYHSSRPNK